MAIPTLRELGPLFQEEPLWKVHVRSSEGLEPKAFCSATDGETVSVRFAYLANCKACVAAAATSERVLVQGNVSGEVVR